jgi:hypothetical protein
VTKTAVLRSGAGTDGGSAVDSSLIEITREQGSVWWIFLREGEYWEQGKTHIGSRDYCSAVGTEMQNNDWRKKVRA